MSATEPSAAKQAPIAEQRVRELAYQIWETEGRPDGQASRHWELAHKLAEVEAGTDDRRPAQRARRLRKPHEAELPAEPQQAAPATRKARPPKVTATQGTTPDPTQ